MFVFLVSLFFLFSFLGYCFLGRGRTYFDEKACIGLVGFLENLPHEALLDGAGIHVERL